MTVKRRRLLEAIKASGWPIMRTGPGMYLATCPSSEVEHPTPAYVPKQMWSSPTFRQLRQLAFNANSADGVTLVMSREGVPWVGVRERTLTLAQAFAFLAEQPDPGCSEADAPEATTP